MSQNVSNTLLAPPRRTGNDGDDVAQLFGWLGDLADVLTLEQYIFGAIGTLQQQVAAILALVANGTLAARARHRSPIEVGSSILAGASLVRAYTLPDVRGGDIALASFEPVPGGLVVTAQATAPNTVQVRFHNPTGAAVVLPDGVTRILVLSGDG